MDRTQKQSLVSTLRKTFEDMPLVVVVQQKGLSVAEVTRLRAQMRNAGAGMKVTKNRLAKRALEGTQHSGLAEYFRGPTAVAYSQDPVAAAKIMVEFANRNDKLSIVGGGLNARVFDSAGIQALAKLPSLQESRAKLAGLLQTPASRLVGVLKAPGSQLARVMSAYAQTSGSAPQPSSSES